MPVPPVPNSSTGGYMVPDAAAPAPYAPALTGQQLEDLFHDVIAGVLALDADAAHQALVRPRFQLEPPNDPGISVDWVAFGLTLGKRDWDRAETHLPTYYAPDVGATITQQDQEMELFISFYGPNSEALQGQFEDGIKLEQNRWALERQGIKFAGAQDAYRLPALLKERFRERWDQKFKFRRRVNRAYPILSIASAAVKSLDNELYDTDIVVTPTSP